MSCGPTKERVCVPGQLLPCSDRSAQIFRFPPGLELAIQTAGCHHRGRGFPHMFLTLYGVELTPPAATREGLAPPLSSMLQTALTGPRRSAASGRADIDRRGYRF